MTWQVVHRFQETLICTEGDRGTRDLIAIMSSRDTENNARLIASAPELLEALKVAVGYIEDDTFAERRTGACLRSVIAKAEGKS